ncbi:MAG TPA: ABC transporter permease [Acidobacteriaceae bacterium]|nr:ABC transporter permease [Acidobacteriaceae bacterium]
MREALLVAKREYVERVRSKAFRISTIVIPLAFAAVIGMGAFSGKMATGPSNIVVASNDLVLAQSTRTELLRVPTAKDDARGSRRGPPQQLQVEVQAPVAESDLASLNHQVESKAIDGYLWLNVQPGQAVPQATYVSRGSADFFGADRMQTAIGEALVREALMNHGVASSQADGLLHDVDLKTRQVKGGEAVASDASKSFWGAYIMAFILYFSVVFYGMNVAHSVVAEKTSRVFEVLLATAKPESLMAGKLLGVGAAGLTQMAVWITAVLLLSASALGAELGQGGLAAYGVTPIQLVFLVLYFLLGFFFYSALSAGFGATVSQESEVQQFSMILVMPQLVGLILMVYILGNPSAWPVVLLSLFPPCTPIVMCLRMSAMVVPWWQLALSVVLMVAATYAVLWVASRIYRVGILMYGKRPTLPEMIRWLSYS